MGVDVLLATLLPSTYDPAAKQPSSLEKPTFDPSLASVSLRGKGGRAALDQRHKPARRSTRLPPLMVWSVTSHSTGSPWRTALLKRSRIPIGKPVNFPARAREVHAPTVSEGRGEMEEVVALRCRQRGVSGLRFGG